MCVCVCVGGGGVVLRGQEKRGYYLSLEILAPGGRESVSEKHNVAIVPPRLGHTKFREGLLKRELVVGDSRALCLAHLCRELCVVPHEEAVATVAHFLEPVVEL
jgi:hypothetical protein